MKSGALWVACLLGGELLAADAVAGPFGEKAVDGWNVTPGNTRVF